MLTTLALFAPSDVMAIIREQIAKLAQGEDRGILTIGILGAVWSSSAAMDALIYAMDRAYGVQESRPWWKLRLKAIVPTIFLAVFILVSFTLVLAGPTLAEWVAALTAHGALLEWSWKILQWPIAVALVTLGIALVAIRQRQRLTARSRTPGRPSGSHRDSDESRCARRGTRP